ncbi:uncharacterized protein J8A68_005592 [[Candida] subhashii]|uniref:GPI transamidase component GAB1 n=1 Tax=[Candida] subhashii TaxID=561895 RepID=A0A8J5UHM0_9ASCO|nr:uncharacterized protein J8A68_005592 [[Candida] subhashii]KAG7660917.1 hypothetical protein J8A68_005592 [[Candida] subhashii]
MSKLNQVFIIGGLIRFLLPTIFPSIVEILGSKVEITTPINAYKSLQEAFYYLQQGIDLYDGGVNHHPPILVIILSFINALPFNQIIFHLLYSLIDLFIAWRIVQLNRWYNDYNSKRIGKQYIAFNDNLIALFYLFNPLIIITNLSHSTIVFSWAFIMEALNQVVLGRNTSRAMIALANATYLSFTPIYLLAPMLALAHSIGSEKKDYSKMYIHGLTIFICTVGLLMILSFASTASSQFFEQCYMTVILFKKITPNVGLWWYLFTEMFEFFTPFYVGMFNFYSIIYVIPITLRLFEYKSTPKQGDSFLALVLVYLWVSFTKSYPTFGDLGLALSIIPIFKNTIIPYCKFIYVTGLTLIITLLLSPIFYYCWIVLGNGNANFFYSINLLWGGVHILIIMDLIWGKLIYDYILQNNISDITKLNLAQI